MEIPGKKLLDQEGATESQTPAAEANQPAPPVHVDVYVNPFLDEKTRQAVIAGTEQDPE